MTTEAQMRANQQNAQKSSGPTSVEGKKKSSMSAVTHGIFSNIAILPGEDEAFIQNSVRISWLPTSAKTKWSGV